LENLIDYLVPALVILSFLSFKSKRKKAKAKEEASGEPQKKSAGLVGKLNKLMEEYYEDDQQGTPQTKSAEADPWEHDPWEVPPERLETGPEVVQVQVPAPPPKVVLKAEEPQVKPQVPVEVKPIQPKPADVDYQLKNVKKEDLRKAIVWSEILGPPVALKKD
jgi:hypothetical protein